MAKRGRGQKKNVRLHQREGAEHREGLERAWFKRLEHEPRFEDLVTSGSASDEPFHRWLVYPQAFSPEFVRAFVSAHHFVPEETLILDPFMGSGTTVLESAKLGIHAIGVEALAPLVALTKAALAQSPPPPLPPLDDSLSLTELAAKLTDPMHRACLIAVAGHKHTAGGNRKATTPPSQLVRKVFGRMVEDLRDPLPPFGHVMVGDARKLALGDASCNAMLTSPPYISRFNYADVAKPLAGLFPTLEAQHVQVRAHRRGSAARGGRTDQPMHTAVREAVDQLQAIGKHKEAQMVAGYFVDMRAFLSEAARVLAPGSPAWIVVGGAFVDAAYVPSDLILAGIAEEVGFRVKCVSEVRRLAHSTGRALGALRKVVPRESIVDLRRR